MLKLVEIGQAVLYLQLCILRENVTKHQAFYQTNVMSFYGLDHCLIGNHHYLFTFDAIRMKWKETCLDITSTAYIKGLLMHILHQLQKIPQ